MNIPVAKARKYQDRPRYTVAKGGKTEREWHIAVRKSAAYPNDFQLQNFVSRESSVIMSSSQQELKLRKKEGDTG